MKKMVASEKNGGGSTLADDSARKRERVDDDSYESLLDLEERNIGGLIERIENGLPYGSWERFLRTTRMNKDDAIELLGMNPRTLKRRKAEGRFRPDESERLIRSARVFQRASGLFAGDVDSTLAWLKAPKIALGGATPLKYAETEIGAREVEDFIGRIEHGILS